MSGQPDTVQPEFRDPGAAIVHTLVVFPRSHLLPV
jgi:hypothetical protein